MLLGLATVHFRERPPGQSRLVFTVQRPDEHDVSLVEHARHLARRHAAVVRAARPGRKIACSGTVRSNLLRRNPSREPRSAAAHRFHSGRPTGASSVFSRMENSRRSPRTAVRLRRWRTLLTVGWQLGSRRDHHLCPQDGSLVPRLGGRRAGDSAARAGRISTRVDGALASLPARWQTLPVCRRGAPMPNKTGIYLGTRRHAGFSLARCVASRTSSIARLAI